MVSDLGCSTWPSLNNKQQEEQSQGRASLNARLAEVSTMSEPPPETIQDITQRTNVQSHDRN